MRELVDEQGQDTTVKQWRSKGALTVCLYALAAVNLAVLLLVTQLPEAPPKVEKVSWQGDPQAGPSYIMDAGKSTYRFQSCTGGGSVNCHRSGNYAGL